MNVKGERMDFFRKLLAVLVSWYVKQEIPPMELYFTDKECEMNTKQCVKVTFSFVEKEK